MREKREAGEMARGGQPYRKSTGAKNAPVETLEKQGIDKHLANAARKAAAVPEDKFEQEIAKARRLARAAAENNSVKEARPPAKDQLRRGGKKPPRDPGLLRRLPLQPLDRDQRRRLAGSCQVVRYRGALHL
jgi:hypothetical protein